LPPYEPSTCSVPFPVQSPSAYRLLRCLSLRADKARRCRQDTKCPRRVQFTARLLNNTVLAKTDQKSTSRPNESPEVLDYHRLQNRRLVIVSGIRTQFHPCLARNTRGLGRPHGAPIYVVGAAFLSAWMAWFNVSIFAVDKSGVAGVELATASEPPARTPRIWGRRPSGVDPSHPLMRNLLLNLAAWIALSWRQVKREQRFAIRCA
jgi:hypothetical protein